MGIKEMVIFWVQFGAVFAARQLNFERFLKMKRKK